MCRFGWRPVRLQTRAEAERARPRVERFPGEPVPEGGFGFAAFSWILDNGVEGVPETPVIS